MLHAVIREHLETFLAEAARGSDGPRLPGFIEQEFRDDLTCGVLAHGCARVRCDACAFERLLPFSCKGRGFCPSGGGRRMTEHAARLVTEVLPHVPVRQWVLSLPYRLRYLLAWNHELRRAVLAVFAGAVFGACHQQARRLANGQTGTFTVIQRFGGGLNLDVQFHTLALDGVYAESGDALVFHGAAPPPDAEVGRVVVTVRRKVFRLLTRHGFAADVEAPSDPLVEESPVLAGITGASVLGQIALGPRAGARVWRLGGDPVPTPVVAAGPVTAEPAVRPRHWRWADLMRRAFDLDVLACPHCGGRVRRLPTIDDPLIIEPILVHLGLPTDRVRADPAPPPPAPPLFAHIA